jgi:hypothetical protein
MILRGSLEQSRYRQTVDVIKAARPICHPDYPHADVIELLDHDRADIAKSLDCCGAFGEINA